MAELTPGIHVLGNGPLDEPFFKAERGKTIFSEILAATPSQSREETVAAFLRLLQDKERCDENLPVEVTNGEAADCHHHLISTPRLLARPPKDNMDDVRHALSSISVYRCGNFLLCPVAFVPNFPPFRVSHRPPSFF
jgi:hypothetical protein